MNEFIIAVFSLRTSTMQFNSALNRGGVKSIIIETPKAASASCGISVRFDAKSIERAKEILKQSGIKNFVRFYYVSFMYNQTRLTPVF